GPPPFFASVQHWYLTSATMLGRRTAELHQTIANSSDPAFVPEPLDARALDALATQMGSHADKSLTTLAQRVDALNDETRAHADAILATRSGLLARFDAVRVVSNAGLRIRVHGDYHLGQVLRTEE